MTYKQWVNGDILQAADQNALSLQTINRFADATARDAAITSPSEGMFVYLTGSNALQYYDGSAWVAADISGGVSWSGSTANGIGTYGSSSSIVAESTATYDGTTLQLTTSGGGLKLDGLASSNANTLDDYEEGEAAVTLTASGGGTITVGTNNTIAYTKIGRVVHIQGELNVASVSSPSTQLSIAGLPFTSSNTLTDMADRSWLSTSVMFLSSAVTSGDIIAMVAANSTTISYFSGGGGSGVQYFANLVDSGTSILIGGSYITDS